MNVVDLVREVLEDQTGVGAALSRIRRPVEPEPGWEETTARAIEELLEEAERLSSPARVEDLGRLAEQAASLLGTWEAGLVALKVGYLLLRRDSPDLALEFLKRANEVAWRDEASSLNSECWLIRCLAELKEFGQVNDLLPRALERSRALDSAHHEVMLLVVAARESSYRGACNRAAQLLRTAVSRSSGMEPDALGGLFAGAPAALGLQLELGMAARDAGRFEMAIEAFERAREMSRAYGSRAQHGVAQELGLTWQLAGADERSSMNQMTSGDGASSPRSALVAAYEFARSKPQDTEAALYLLKEVHKEIRGTGSKGLEQHYYTVLGLVRAGAGQLNLARVAFAEALHLAIESGRPLQAFNCRFNLGLILIDLRQLGDAQRELETTLEVGEALRDMVESTEIHRSVTAHLVKATEKLALIYAHGWRYDSGDRSGQRRDPSQLLRLGQGVKAVNLLRWIALRDEAARKQGDAEVAMAIRQLCGIEAEVERAAMSADRPLGPIFEKHRQVQRGLEARGVSTERWRCAPMGHPELRTQLPRSTALIDLISGPEEVYFSCLLPSGEMTCGGVSWPRDERISFLTRWSASVARGQRLRLQEPPPPGWRLDSDPLRAVGMNPESATPSRLLEELRASFFEPLFEAAGLADAPGRLFVLPHRELFSLPFGFAADLLGVSRLSLLPNVGSLGSLQSRSRTTGGCRAKVGDATGTLDMVPLELSWLDGFAAVEPTVGGIIEGSRDATLLHFAGHGIFDDINPYDSGLVVGGTLPAELDPDLFKLVPRSRGRHRQLSVAGILGSIDLPRCSLVTLSACCTGLARIEPASEFLSLPAAFLVAGARNVVASLWPVHDGATALLMGEFYRCLEGGDTPPSVALRRACLHLRTLSRAEAESRLGTDRWLPDEDPPFASPVFTMAFQHYGVD